VAVTSVTVTPEIQPAAKEFYAYRQSTGTQGPQADAQED
jgi:hypothetical protein